jgi:PAS domain S-box-containing protein
MIDNFWLAIAFLAGGIFSFFLTRAIWQRQQRRLREQVVETVRFATGAIRRSVAFTRMDRVKRQEIEGELKSKLRKCDRQLLAVRQELQAEVALRQLADAKQQESETNFRYLVETVKDYAIYLLDPQGYIVSWNDGAERIKGYTAEEIIGQHFSRFYVDEDIECGHPDYELILTEAQGRYEEEGWRLRKDGSVFWANVVTIARRDQDSSLKGFCRVIHDVTMRKQAEIEIRNALAQEKELNELKSRFISMTSHEFRTPLSTILSSAELLEYYADKLPPAEKSELFRQIGTATKRMTELLEDVLAIEKAESGKLQFNPATLDLEKFCQNLVAEMQLTAGNNHQIFFTNFGDCKNVFMDEKLLTHILSNLLSNAMKYSPQGGIVKFDLDCNDREAIFQIQDSGIGIPLEDQAKLFESFHRARNVGNISGTGLGLFIVKTMVDLHKGKISVNSQVGFGTTFTAIVPCKF